MINISEIVNEFGFEVNTLMVEEVICYSYQKDKGSHIDINSSEFLNYIFDSLETIKSKRFLKILRLV